MVADAEEDALSWGGSEADHIESDAVEGPGGPARDAESADAAAQDAAPQNPVLLVAYGVFAGMYLLFVVGWITAVRGDSFTQSSIVAEVMYQFGEFLAIASPAIWMFAVFVLTRGRRPRTRLLLLLLGALLLAPWPVLLGGAS